MAPALRSPPLAPVPRKFDYTRIAKLYAKHRRSRQVARILGCARSTVLDALHALGLPVAPAHRPRTALDGVSGADILRLLADGLTYRQIADTYDGVPSSVCRKLHYDRKRPLPPLGRCALCGKRATLHHHVTYVPEKFAQLCRGCHTRVHHSADPPAIPPEAQLHRRD